MTHQSTLTPITADAFPTSPLALRTNDPAAQARVKAFAGQMAAAANTAARALADDWNEAGASLVRRVAVLREVHASLIDWRHGLAAASAGRLGVGVPLDAERFRTPVTTRNLDRLGYVGRLREGAGWDAQTRTYVGGSPTPAHEAMAAYGRAAEARFAAEAPGQDVLQNWITLPRGLRLDGNQLLRGARAEQAAAELAARIAARGLDASRVETGGNPIYTHTPDSVDAEMIHAEALALLADPESSVADYLLGRYMLFQAPTTKKGSDAVNRVLSVAVGTVLYGPDAPALHADEDLRAYVLGQAAATAVDGGQDVLAAYASAC